MQRIVFDVGDEVGYPDLFATNPTRRMTVIDRAMFYYPKSKKMFIRYLCSDVLKLLAEDIRKNVEKEYDNLIIIDGKEGSGKSNLAVALCREIEPGWDLEKGYIYNYAEFVQAITGEEDDHKRVFLLDEGSLVANKRESMSEDSKRFIELLETMRSRGWTLVMCIPSADRLDVYIREYRIRYLLHAEELQWDIVNRQLSRGYFDLLMKKGNSLDTFRTVAYGTFPKMSPEDKTVYDRLKKASQKRLMDKIAGKEPPKENRNSKIVRDQKDRISKAALALQDKGLSTPEIARAIGAPEESVKDYLERGRKLRDQAKVSNNE